MRKRPGVTEICLKLRFGVFLTLLRGECGPCQHKSVYLNVSSLALLASFFEGQAKFAALGLTFYMCQRSLESLFSSCV